VGENNNNKKKKKEEEEEERRTMGPNNNKGNEDDDDVGGVIIDSSNQRMELTASSTELERMMTCIEQEILPVTREGVANGNKVFGAAILNAMDWSTVHVGTNNELKCPLLHGEMNLIYEWSKLVPSSVRGTAARNDSIFLSTHEPCCMCISGILWSGFTKVYYFFPYTSTAAQGIPYDINTMHELWGVRYVGP
jgi:tRNA(Arg) A34 adenosine deaminase TadA